MEGHRRLHGTRRAHDQQLRFPIHRPAGAPRTAVLAFADEIDRWLAESPVRKENRQASNGTVPDCVPHLHELHSRVKVGMERVSATQTQVSETLVLLDRLKAKLKRSRELRQKRFTETHTLLGIAQPFQNIDPPPANH